MPLWRQLAAERCAAARHSTRRAAHKVASGAAVAVDGRAATITVSVHFRPRHNHRWTEAVITGAARAGLDLLPRGVGAVGMVGDGRDV